MLGAYVLRVMWAPLQSRREYLGMVVSGVAGCSAAGTGPTSRARTIDPELAAVEGRPRLLVGEDRFDRIASMTDTGYPRRWAKQLRAAGDEFVDAEPVRDGDAEILLDRAVSSLARVRALACAVELDLDDGTDYRERVWEELDALVALPDWNPSHFLDTAVFGTAAAIGYDWLYDSLSADRREALREALRTRLVERAVRDYDRGGWWTRRRNNWGFVTNGGVALAALALAGEESVPEDLLDRAFRNALDRLRRTATTFGRDGGWPEGLGYWRFGTQYLVYTLASLEAASRPLPDIPSAVTVTGNFPLGLSGPERPFNFGDSGLNGLVDAPWLLWLAARHDRPDWVGYQLAAAGRTEGIEQNLLWFDPDLVPDSDGVLTRAARFRDVSVVSFRDRPSLDMSAFLGFKADNTALSHGDLDGGSIVFALDGVDWAVDLGPDDYDLPGYWDTGGGRWRYYRKRAEGHNTLVFASDDAPDQRPNGTGRVERFVEGDAGGFAVADLSSLYRRVTEARRGVALLDDGNAVLVQDEVTPSDSDHVWWFLHTPAALTVDGRTATLRRAGETVHAELLEPSDASFDGWNAVPLSDAPDPPEQAENAGVVKLVISRDIDGPFRLAVRFTTDSAGTLPPVEPLSSWSRESLVDGG